MFYYLRKVLPFVLTPQDSRASSMSGRPKDLKVGLDLFFTLQTDSLPGPGAYRPEGINTIGQSSPAATMKGRHIEKSSKHGHGHWRLLVFSDFIAESSPGPGAYSLSPSKPAGGAFSFTGRRSEKVEVTPGPGEMGEGRCFILPLWLLGFSDVCRAVWSTLHFCWHWGSLIYSFVSVCADLPLRVNFA